MRIKSLQHARKIVEKAFCPECGKLRTATPSGAVCPDHRLRLGVTEEELAVAGFTRHLLCLPCVQAVPNQAARRGFTIDGKLGEYRARKDGNIEAIDTHRRLRVRKYKLIAGTIGDETEEEQE